MDWQNILTKIRTIKERFDKSYKCLNVNRPTKEDTIEKHITKLFSCLEEIRVILNVHYHRLTKAHKITAETFFADLREKLLQITTKKGLDLKLPISLHEKIVYTTKGIENIQLTKMNTTDLASISKLIPIFGGRREDLSSFISNLEFIENTLEDTKKPSFFQFVLKTRLEQRVQNRIKQNSMPTSLQELINELRKCYKSKETPNNILNKLNKIKQQGDVRKFAEKIDSLITELNELQISNIGEANRNAIIQSNNIIAFNAFKNGLTNRDIANTIEASRVKTFTEALEIAEETISSNTQHNIMYQNARQRQNNRNIYSRNNNSWNNNNENNTRNNNNSHYINRNQYRNNTHRHRNNRNNYRNNTHRQNITNFDRQRPNYNNNNNNVIRNRNTNNTFRNINQINNQENYQVPENIHGISPEETN